MALITLLVRLQVALLSRGADDDGERGDVPGWVLITIMTAGLVTLVWGVASAQLRDILTSALNSVTHP